MNVKDIDYTPLTPPVSWIGRVKKFVATLSAANSADWAAFAVANNWAAELANPEDIPPSINRMSGAKPDSLAIIADLDGFTQRILTCYGDLPYLIIAVSLPKAFPHIVLNSIKNDGGSQFLFENSKRVSLEGNIDRYFRLYINKDENIDALSIVMPDVMACLIDKNVKQDLEIYKNKLYFIAEMPRVNAETLKAVLESTQKPIKEILHRANTLNYSAQNSVLLAESHVSIPGVILTPTRKAKILMLIVGIPLIILGIYMIIIARNFRP